LTSFFGELRRRNVVRVAVAYAIVGWVLIEVSSVIAPAMNLPNWATSLVVFFVILGFPLALILSWAYEITPEGIKLERDVAAGESITHVTGRKIDFAIIGALVLALGFVVYNYVLVDSDQEAVVQETAATVEPAAETPAPVVVEEQREVLPNSVAVLPFENLSPDPDNEYYAAGIHEEILNQLVKLSALNVIARTSMRQYANTEKSIPEIARELNVETVMEGSVRYDAGRIRITAQLNDGITGAHLWSETYTRDFDDIFAIESDVAMNVANALAAEFSLAEQGNIEKPPTKSADSYAAYLKAMAIIGEGESAIGVSASPGTRSAIQSYLDEALELDSEFALAHAWKAFIYALSREYDPFTEEAWLDRKAELDRLVSQHADAALALDPSNGLAQARGTMHFNNWRGELTQVEVDQALQLSPNDPDVLRLYAHFELNFRDRPDEAIGHLRRSSELDPHNSLRFQTLGYTLHVAGRHAEAIEALRECLAIDSSQAVCSLFVARSEFARGNDEAALDALRLAEQLLPGDASPAIRGELAYAYGRLRQADDAQRAFAIVEELAGGLYVDSSTWAWAYMGVGDYDEALRQLNIATENLELLQLPWLAHFIRQNVWNDPVLEQPEFVEVRSRLGFRE